LDHQTVTQTTSTGTINPPAVAADHNTSNTTKRGNAELAALWNELRLAYPIYASLAVQFKLPTPPYPAGDLPPVRPTRSAFDRDLKWLDEIDDHVLAYQLRQIPSEILNGTEPGLRAFIQRHVKKQPKTIVDRDKLDWLLVQYFALCVPEGLYRENISLADVAGILQPIVAGGARPDDSGKSLEKVLAQLETCHSLRDIMENGIFEQSRMIKDAAGASFYTPAALIAFCRFNFLVRRTFIRVLHSDLKAMGEAIDALEARGKRTVDCRRAGLSAAETTSQLRYFCANWKQPFQKDYTESSVSRALEQLLALRTDLEEALGPAQPVASPAVKPSEPPVMVVSQPPKSPAPSQPPAREASSSRFNWGRLWGRKSQQPTEPQPAEASNEPASMGTVEADNCLKLISAQLSGVPNSPKDSMSTISLQDTKVLLSSWEVAAFLTDAGIKSEDLRRAVVARALLAVAVDQRKRSGEQASLSSALSFARSELSYLQGRVENAKRTNNTESAINLGISTKRLLSSLEEAEKLQS
jgi:hypothetical protein